MTLCPYTRSDAPLWDAVVNAARNATFLHTRAFMDYHADRFTEVSVMICRGKQPIALFPATAHGEEIVSHGGLTYGGLLVLPEVHGEDVLEIVGDLKAHYSKLGFHRLTVRPAPYIYCIQPSDDIRYALFRHGAQLMACSLSSTINLRNPLPYSTLRNRCIKRALRSGIQLIIVGHEDVKYYAEYWQILASVLTDRHATKPVHTLQEMLLLASRFPNNIRLVLAIASEGCVLAGTWLFLTSRTAHTQYLAVSPEGRTCGALDYILSSLAKSLAIEGFDYLDFGISTECGGKYLNSGLLSQKEGFGARSVTYETYTMIME